MSFFLSPHCFVHIFQNINACLFYLLTYSPPCHAVFAATFCFFPHAPPHSLTLHASLCSPYALSPSLLLLDTRPLHRSLTSLRHVSLHFCVNFFLADLSPSLCIILTFFCFLLARSHTNRSCTNRTHVCILMYISHSYVCGMCRPIRHRWRSRRSTLPFSMWPGRRCVFVFLYLSLRLYHVFYTSNLSFTTHPVFTELDV